MNPNYKITDEDIQSIVDYLKVSKPAVANRENAEIILHKMYEQLHIVRNLDPKIIEKLTDELQAD